MRTFWVIASLIAIAYSARVKIPRLTLIEERSINGAPTVSITFPDGYTDTLVLEKYHANEEDRIANEEHCNYIGHLAEESEACVAMTGCVGFEDVELTVLSTHATYSPMFKWTKDGNVEMIGSMFKNGLRTYENQTNDVNDEIVDEEREPAFIAMEANCASGGCDPLPSTQHLQIRVGYDNGLYKHLGGKSKTEKWIAATWTHIQARYCLATLDTKVFVERLSGIKHFSNIIINNNNGKNLNKMRSETLKNLYPADLMLYFGFNEDKKGFPYGGGIATKNVICEPWGSEKKHSINLFGTSRSAVAESAAHEIGHNLGMAHDFAVIHGGKLKADGKEDPDSTNPCNHKGLMSYDTHPIKWSSCSNLDFKTQYNMIGKAEWCMPEKPDACARSCKKDVWIADGYCDPQNNNVGCQWDGGDCCDNWRQDWKKYCKSSSNCKCKDPSHGTQDCDIITVDLKNIANESQGSKKGTYEISETINGKPSWISNDQAIWWVPEFSQWGIGPLYAIGSNTRGLTGSSSQWPYDQKCTWFYWNGSFFTTPGANDIKVQCKDDCKDLPSPNWNDNLDGKLCDDVIEYDFCDDTWYWCDGKKGKKCKEFCKKSCNNC